MNVDGEVERIAYSALWISDAVLVVRGERRNDVNYMEAVLKSGEFRLLDGAHGVSTTQTLRRRSNYGTHATRVEQREIFLHRQLR